MVVIFKIRVIKIETQKANNIAIEIQKLPDTNLNPKQVQQFLGFVNYIGDVIPDISKHTNSLAKLLRKNPPS